MCEINQSINQYVCTSYIRTLTLCHHTATRGIILQIYYLTVCRRFLSTYPGSNCKTKEARCTGAKNVGFLVQRTETFERKVNGGAEGVDTPSSEQNYCTNNYEYDRVFLVRRWCPVTRTNHQPGLKKINDKKRPFFRLGGRFLSISHHPPPFYEPKFTSLQYRTRVRLSLK